MIKRRLFSQSVEAKNLKHLDEGKSTPHQTKVGFLLLEHFSLPAFTQVLDSLVTANLITPTVFLTRTFSMDGAAVASDLGLFIYPTEPLTRLSLVDLDLFVICGGLRTPLQAYPALREAAHIAAEHGISLAGLWSGAWFLGEAGLLNGYRCAIHPEHRAALSELAKHCVVTSESFTVADDRLTAASPSGAFSMVLEWIRKIHGHKLADGVVDILAFEETQFKRTSPSTHKKVSEPLREVLNLMHTNIEEPLSLEQLSHYAKKSNRQIERLFKDQLYTSPARYYLELRVTESRRLLQHSTLPIIEVAVACGFVSPSHFSKCYTAFFGHSPSMEIRYDCVRSGRANYPKKK
ncbi:HTH-type transcriptional regulator CdhR [Pseudomonas fluorescens]|uniref:GlxA family transcriptional regulator n=1 Tax=Pseudomonas fluorescens TaxID=294 RepID=UPI001254C9A8|nr:GlxA family transcriptional regulator [Pseudomonas fluorescens]VVO54790.1 HTH-type transcriptional regulator CdhR [Pseudomonas fluorescens]